MTQRVHGLDRRTLRILFVNCPNLDTTAASYLLLAQNEHQSLFEFEVYSLWVPAELKYEQEFPRRFEVWDFFLRLAGLCHLRWAVRRYRARRELEFAPEFRAELGLNASVGKAGACLSRYDAWLRALPIDYGNRGMAYGPALIVTETPLHGAYLSMLGENVGVVTIAGWHRQYSPPSVLEFVLSNVQRAALRMLITNNIGSHFPTRGCVWDFTATVEDARMCVAAGYLCKTCRATLFSALGEDQVAALEAFLRNDWIGSVDDNSSVASDLKRIFRYDLARTRGLSPSLTQRLVEFTGRKVVERVATFVLAFAAAWYAFYVTKPVRAPEPQKQESVPRVLPIPNRAGRAP
jgi:hypothetical protein